jgi:hypothetical protein
LRRLKTIGTGIDGACTQGTATGVNFDQLVSNELVADGILPSIAIPFSLAQNRLENNNYTSNLFVNYNNLNGYKYVSTSQYQSGQGPISPEGDYYAAYACLEDSAQEQSAWWARRAAAGFDLTTLTTPAAFVAELAAMQWFGSSVAAAQAAAPAYLSRLNYCLTLVNIQASTGLDTTGYLGQYGQIIAAAAVIGVIYIVMK